MATYRQEGKKCVFIFHFLVYTHITVTIYGVELTFLHAATIPSCDPNYDKHA